MAILQISKIQHRTGANTDLPQLDVGEIGFSTDEQRMFIGNDPVLHPPANSAVTTQTEILTEHSDIAFSKIVGTANGVVNFSNVSPGQLVVARNVANTTSVEWINAGGNSKQPGNASLYANANIHLGHVDYVKLGGGTNGYILQTDGAGNLTWAAFLSGTVVSGTPGGANSQIQYNEGGTSFGGSAGFTYNKVTGELINSGNIVGNNINGPTFGAHNGTVGATTPNSGAFTSIVVSNNATVTGNIFAGNANITSRLNVTGNANVGNLFSTGTANVANLRVSSRVQSSLVPSSDQTYDLGTASLKWKDLYLSGTTLYLGAQTLQSNTNGIAISGNAYVANFVVANGFAANSLSGTVTTSAQPNITSLGTLSSLNVNGVANLGAVTNLRISGGVSGFVLTSNGAGGVSWLPGGGGGAGGTPGGANTQVQFNNAGTFEGDAGFTYTRTSSTLAAPNISVTGVLTTSDVSNVRVPGGAVGQFLRTDGSGGLSWATPGGGGNPGGTNTQVQFNDGGNFAGNLNLLFFKTTQTLQVPNIDATITSGASSQPNITTVGNLVNLKVIGNTTSGNITSLGNSTATLFVGSGASLTNINGANVSQVPNANFASYSTNATSANVANTVSVAAQPNITSVGNLTGLKVVGSTDLGPISNVKITGGVANYLLATDGAGNLSWASSIAPDSNANAVQFNNSGTFNGSSSFTFDSASNTLSVPSTTTTLTVASNAQPNITSVGTLVNLTVTGNVVSGNATLGNSATANFFIGSGNNLSNIQAANITGVIANANYSAYTGDVINATQSNITSVGTLINLDVTGDANVGGNVNGDIVVANFVYGDGSNLANISGSSINGIIANANYSAYAGYVTSPVQANITGVGNLTALRVKTTSFTNADAVAVIGTNNTMYMSTSGVGVSLTDGTNQTGAGIVTFNALVNSVLTRAVGFVAPKLANAAQSETLALIKNDSSLPNAHSIIPTTNFTTNLGGTDEALGEVYFRQVSAAGINLRDTSDSPGNWPLATTWQILAGADGLYISDGFGVYKISVGPDVSGSPGVPSTLGPDPS